MRIKDVIYRWIVFEQNFSCLQLLTLIKRDSFHFQISAYFPRENVMNAAEV